MKQKLNQKQSLKLSLTPHLKKQIELLSNSNEESKKELLVLVKKYLDKKEKPVRYFQDLIDINKYSSFINSEIFLEKKTFENSQNSDLQDELLEQLNLSNLKEYQILIGHYLIDYIDSEGRLSFEVDYSDIEDLVKETYSLSISKKEINQVLGKIQKFDPVGCGYSSLEESLLIQSEELYEDVINKKRVKNLIKEIGKNTIKYENLDQEDKKLLSRLNFLPSYNNLVKEESYIRPDLVVKKQNENFVVVLNDKFLNETLYQMIANKINDLKKDTDVGMEEKNIVVGLKKREESLVEVGKVIISHQIEYIKGKGPLVPLGLSDIADECNLSKSTISRIVSSKLIEINNKITPLSEFLQRKINSKSKIGADTTAKQLEEKIMKIITDEDPNLPLSDEKIRNKLSQEYEIEVARRTVAKYRSVLNISTSKRRKI